MDPVTITINGNVVHHRAQREGGAHFCPDASHTNYLILQSFSPLDDSQREQLRVLGVGIQQVISGNTYFCKYDPHELQELRSLPFLHFINPYHPEYVVEDALKAGGSKSPDEERHEVYITPHDDCSSPEDLRALAQKIADRLHVDAADFVPQTGYLRGYLKPEELDIVAKFDQVRFISEAQEDVAFNWTARGDINILDAQAAAAMFKSENEYECEGEIVAVADMGFDADHPAFASVGSSSTGSRAVAKSWRQLDPGDVTDLNAHGTHVAGSVAGNWNSPGVQAPIMGTAPKAKLYCQVLFEKNGTKIKYPADQSFETVIKEAKDIGATVHTNSWGTPLRKVGTNVEQNGYTVESVAVDKAAWDNRDFTILFAAGNDGRYATPGGQIGAQASCKNCITVGACEPSHPLDYNPARAPVSRYTVGQPRGNTNRMGFFSSVGPTKNSLDTGSNSRIKPDVVAPGACIYSAKSRQATQVGDGAGKPFDYLGTPPDNTSPNDLFIFQQGTSMATPLVAGSCAVIRKALSIARISITSALIKAILVNGTTDMTTARVTQRMIGKRPITLPPTTPETFLPEAAVAISQTPSYQQGFGRINQAKSLLCIPSSHGDYGGVYPPSDPAAAALPLGVLKEIIIDIPTAPSTDGTSLGTLVPKLTVTMCYTDAPSVLNSGSLVNKVAMNVKAGGQVRYGNKSDTDTVPDRVNNVQKVVWTNIPVGEAKICVKCLVLNWGIKGSALGDTTGGQDFAVAWYLEWMDSSDNLQYQTLSNSMTSVAAIAAIKAFQAEEKKQEEKEPEKKEPEKKEPEDKQ
ncbi:peptidase S8/S53 domain-containing protein [Fusarium redolens]|uniref:Peptidase S8/S53 domain-containing protein n=1 Tax=Fusarium redolens TaxID=48865 RepID=A0A9P9JQN1_FUSRE|nr:peptidase S8/S53 domain-containing protein [Fusarium redolens]KAH7227154.1 peptidase S8/S53 domain-containing protein [Fusarium redolens]